MADKEIGIRLKEARDAAKLTQKEVCETIGIPKTQTLSAYESGVNNPPIDILKSLSQLYQVSIDWIAFGEDSPLFERKKISDYITELFKIVDILGLSFREETDSNGNGTGRYVVYVENNRRKEFNNLVASLGRINGIREDLEPDEYDMLFQKKISTCATKSNDFEEIEECSAPVNDSTKDGFPEICDPGDLPF